MRVAKGSKMPRKLSYTTGLLAAVLAWTAMPAYAYLDPGTGSMILQVLLGGHSADLLIPLRGRETGPARVEVTICHRGARLTTLMLRPEVRTLHSQASRAAASGTSHSSPQGGMISRQASLSPRPGDWTCQCLHHRW